MKIKQTTFYAIRILGRINEVQDKVVTSKEIAEKEELSHGVTLKVLRQLSYAGVVHAHQGRGQRGGGFTLAKSIDDITMGDIIMALEGLDIGANLDEATREKAKALDSVCNQINQYLGKLFSRYSIRHLLGVNDKNNSGEGLIDNKLNYLVLEEGNLWQK